MLSGIGPSRELEQHDIQVAVDLPGVGRNLVDHPVVDLYYKNRFNDSPRHVNPSTIPQVFQLISSIIQYAVHGTGALVTNVRVFFMLQRASNDLDTIVGRSSGFRSK